MDMLERRTKRSDLICLVGRDIEYGRRAISSFLSKGIEIAAIGGQTAPAVYERLAAERTIGSIPLFPARRPWQDDQFLRFVKSRTTSLGVVCGFDYIVAKELLDHLQMVNCHPSALPLHRGCHHSFWGIMEKTKFGASIHWVTPELDSGPIIAQKIFEDDGVMNAATIQHKSIELCLELFDEKIIEIMEGLAPATPQTDGTYHSKAEIVEASTLHSGDTIAVDRLFDLCRATNNKNNGFIVAKKDGRRFMVRISSIDEL
jgi:methionyl-tRNA formyltransferase